MQPRLLIFYILTTITLYSACSFHANNWQGNNPPGLDRATFSNFTGKNVDTITIPKGGNLVVDYTASALQGSLVISVKDKHNTIWQKEFTGTRDSGQLIFKAPAETKYKITIEGKAASGSFDVRYRKSEPKQIQVATNKNIELFGLVVQLDNGEQLLSMKDSVVIEGKRTTWQNWYRLTLNNYLQYKQFSNADMVNLYRDYGKKGYTDDFFIGFLLQVDEVPNAKINTATDTAFIRGFSPGGNMEEGKKKAGDFLDALNTFYKQTAFDNYLTANLCYYTMIKADVAKNLPAQGFIDTMEHFYQKQFNNYTLVPSLNLLTGVGYGKMNNITHSIYNTFGPFSFQTFDEGKLDLGFNFPDRIQNLSVHEFGHSFVNPAIDKVPKDVIAATEYLYTPIKDQMTKFSYPTWTVCLYEHFVRAGEIIIARKLGNTAHTDKVMEDNVNTKFIYLPAIVKQLEIYDSNKALYKSYDDFVATIVANLKPVQ